MQRLLSLSRATCSIGMLLLGCGTTSEGASGATANSGGAGPDSVPGAGGTPSTPATTAGGAAGGGGAAPGSAASGAAAPRGGAPAQGASGGGSSLPAQGGNSPEGGTSGAMGGSGGPGGRASGGGTNSVPVPVTDFCRAPGAPVPPLTAFPGAEGFGAFAKGGRGGDVYHVKNLSGSGAGSFREAVESAPAAGRTIVFDVSGYSEFSGTIRVTKPNLTVAGQTAPGDGFALKGGTFLVSAPNVIVRHMRFRNTHSADSVNLDDKANNTIWDHIDVMFSHDENMSSFKVPPDNFTFQYSINAWGLETHSAGGLWDMKHATSHHSLWSHNHTRNPKARAALLNWVNNVTFDWDIGFIMGDSSNQADWRANVIGSTFVSTAPKDNALEKARIPNFSLFMDDSVLDGNANGVFDVTKRDFEMASGNHNVLKEPVPSTADYSPVSAGNPVVGLPVTRQDSLTAYKAVLSSVGPLRTSVDPQKPLRDELDQILVDNVMQQKKHRLYYKKLEASGATNKGLGTLKSEPAPADADGDGMPDFWEKAISSDPNKANNNDEQKDCEYSYVPGDAGYTRLEDYLQWLAMPHGVVNSGGAATENSVEVDLLKFMSGLLPGAVFTLSSPAHGRVELAADGHTARFYPEADYIGRAGFVFEGKDSDGSVLRESVGVLVLPAM